MTAALLVDALAVYRATRLVTEDDLTQRPREAVIRWTYRRNPKHWRRARTDRGDAGWTTFAQVDDDAPMLATLVSCRWCASVHVAAAAVLARRLMPRAWAPLSKVLAFSAVAALLSGLEP